MPASAERRYTPVPVESRAKDGLSRIGGYAAVFNRESRNLGGFVERIAPGAFNDSKMRGWPDVLARYNHDDGMLLGTTGSGTLRLMVDETGLDYTVDLPAARADVAELVARGDVRKSSFAFRTLEDTWTTNEQNYPLRTLVSAQLVDVAPVNTPAYLDTTSASRASVDLAIRSLAAFVQADVEEVRGLAEADELRKFFVRTDAAGQPVKRAKPGMFGHAAAAALLARRSDPFV